MYLIAADLFRLLVLPPAGLFLLLLFAWLLRRAVPGVARVMQGTVLLIFYVLCTPAGANLMVAPLEDMTRPLTDATHTGAQAIVVLAAGRIEFAPEYGDSHVPDYIALARLRYAARLQHETGLPLLVSGGNRAQDGGHDSKAASMARALRDDFRTPVTWVEENSETTAENAGNTRTLLQASGISRILLVTDAMHMARAESMFAATGLQVTAAPTIFLHLQRYDLRALVPDAEGLRRAYYASYEWIGLFWYALHPVASNRPPSGLKTTRSLPLPDRDHG